MSTNISKIDIVQSLGFRIARTKVERLREEFADSTPDSSVFDQCLDRRDFATFTPGLNGDELIYLHGFWWHGECSGWYEDALVELLAEFEGEADLVLTWEGGEFFTGLRLRDGTVTRHEVVMELGDEAEG